MSGTAFGSYPRKATRTRSSVSPGILMDSKRIEENAGTVAVVGRPNVGKSALFNRLVGRNIAIVHDQPGITRDRLASTSKRGRRPFTVWDTGGIGGGGETELTTEVRLAADAAMRESDVILFVVDGQAGLNPIDRDLAKLLRKSKRPVVLVVNKIDHEKHEPLEADFAQLGFDNPVAISSAHGRGITTLLELVDALFPQSPIANRQSRIENPPLCLAIVGKPNAGKSSLINAILRDTRTIVSELPGTTRDAVDILYERAGERFLLKVGAKCTANCAMNGRQVELRDENGDVLSVGHLGETAPFRLPYSGVRVNVSDVYWRTSWPFDRRTAIAPDIYAPPTFAAYRDNRDPAMDAILEHLGPPTAAPSRRAPSRPGRPG